MRTGKKGNVEASVACPFPEKTNKVNYFRFDKEIINSKIWARLPKASKSIFPAIAIHSNDQGISWPSQQTIGLLSGCSLKTVREGIVGLERLLPAFTKIPKVNARGHRFYLYQMYFPPIEKGKTFHFYRAFIDGGNWRLLSSVSKAVYPAIRAFSYFDPDEYGAVCNDIEGHEDAGLDNYTLMAEGFYKERSFDLSTAEADVIAEYAGISLRSVRKALNDMADKGFIEWHDPYWLLHRLPPHKYKREHLINISEY